ncbi:5-methylcytosine-specific restriction protein A [Sphingomonas sp. BK345]|nr:5-methylcytosine-specific restriction protein A [Sphingomonas sp. BK345]
MPSKPPMMRPRAPRKAWSTTRPVARLRGRAGMADRGRIKAEEPLCRTCLDKGRVTATEVVDHIKPLSSGGSDDRSNKQGLCRECHDAKSKLERAASARLRQGGW